MFKFLIFTFTGFIYCIYLASFQRMSDKENERKFIGGYKIVDKIGKGGFGTVYLCEDITGAGKKVAIKEIPKASKSKIDPQTEIDIHTRLAEKKSSRFVKLIDNFVENDNVYLVMEYCAEGSLKDYVSKHGPMGVLLATDVIRQLCSALKLMHEENIAHRDLTPGNVLIREIQRGRNGGEVKRISVKVTDFGLSKETPKNAHGQFKTTLGTAPFMAPEVKEGKYYTKALDMFSLGSVFYTLLTKDYLPPKQKQFNLITILGKVMGMQSVQALDEEVRNNLKDLLSGMLCSERDRIKLEEIDMHPFMGWFYEERGQDPEWREFCSHSRSTNDTKRRNSRSRSRDFLMRQPQLQQQPIPIRKPNNRDSALGSSDHAQQYQQPSQSHSGSGRPRCHHLEMDPDTGRCRNCRTRLDNLPATSSAATFAGLKSSAVDIRQMAFDGLRSEPIARMNQPKFLTDSNPIGHQKLRNTALMVSQPKTAPIMPARPQQQTQNNTNREALYMEEQPPWPFPRIRHDYTHVNERGRCIFYKYSSSSRGQFFLVAFMEKTASTQDQTIAGIFEIWQNGHGEQELRVFEPKSRNAQRPEKGASKTKTGQAISTIRSCNELMANKAAKKGYVTLWGFLKVMASKAIKASCQEKWNGRKYRVDLCLNGWARLYLGPEKWPEAELEHWGVQKAEDAEFEMKRGDLAREEVHLAEELAQTLRLEVKQSALMAPNFDGRNIRCTVYT